ncbi:MAG: site-specific integrase [Clostridiales bacterium]|nr:site-specific integrase [Clostridiales bacterium]
MGLDKNGKPMPKGITWREKEDRYMGRFTYHGKGFTTYGKTVKETSKNLEELRYEVVHGIYFKDDSVTFSAWFEIWISDYKKPSVKKGTVEVYRQNYNAYIKDVFGNKQLRDIRTDHIQRFYNGMAEKYSHHTLEICRAVLNGVFKQAIRNELIRKNPVANAVLPRDNRRKTIRVMTEEEQKLFLQYARNSAYYPMFELALFTGMRSGEIRGLQWSDVDFKNRIIHVTHTLVYVEHRYQLDSPKTGSSEREIPMLDNVYKLLKEHRKEQMELSELTAGLFTVQEGFENLVFINPGGYPVNRDRFKKAIDQVVDEIQKDGYPFAQITPHTFRHTFATRSIEMGIPPKVLQTILGHHDLSTTMDTYAHVLPDTKKKEMEKLSALIS